MSKETGGLKNLKILSIDTTCNTCQVALTDGRKLLGSYSENDRRTHSVKLLPAIENIVKEAGLEPSDIDLLAVTNGPGSYTGMRIGVSTAKAIAYGTGAPLVGVNTLDFLAFSSARSLRSRKISHVCALINARNERVYSCIYDRDLVPLCTCLAGDLKDVCEELSSLLSDGKKVLFCGDGSVDYKEQIEEYLPEKAVFSPKEIILGDAKVINDLAEKIYRGSDDKSEFSAEKLTIEYLRPYLREDK